MPNTPTTDPVQTDYEGEEMREVLISHISRHHALNRWQSEAQADALLKGPIAQLQAELIAVRRERDAFEQEVKGLRERLLGASAAQTEPSPSVEPQSVSPASAASVSSRGPLLAKAREQFAYWSERVRREKCFEDCLSEDGLTYTPMGDEDAYQSGYCQGRRGEAEWWLKTIEAMPAPSHDEIVAEMDRNIKAAAVELSRVFPPSNAIELCECRIGDCVSRTRICREDQR